MILISHRGNMNGPDPQHENGQKYCEETLERGFHVEIDVWYTDTWWTGHDRPQYRVDPDFLKKEEVWCHAKNIEALYRLQEMGAHCFFHQKDDVVLTSKGYLWTYPSFPLTKKSICVLPEIQKPNKDYSECAGICSDYVVRHV
jgi:hypothetical protein